MSIAVVLDSLKKLGGMSEIELCILLKKNGNIVAASGKEDDMSLETFGLMTATIFGAANTANEHLRKNKPERIVMRAIDGDTILKKVDDEHVLIIRTGTRENFSSVLDAMDEEVEFILNNWEEVIWR